MPTTPRTTELAIATGEPRFRALVENISDAIALLDRQGAIIYSGPSTARILGYEPGQNVGLDAFLLVHPDDRFAARERFRALVQSPGAVTPLEYRLLHRDGSWRHMEGSAQNLLDEPGVQTIVVTYRDVTERIAVETALRESEERYRSVVAALDEGIIVQNLDGTITEANESACRILGLHRDLLIGRTSLDNRWHIVHEDGSAFPPDAHPAMIALRTGQPQTGVILGIGQADGTTTWLSVNSQPLTRSGGHQPYAAVTSFSDITERKRSEAQLMHAAHHDVLTGLPNRSHFAARLAEMFSRAIRDTRPEPRFALLFLDFDCFKAVNDTFGHGIGDEVLAAIAHRLEALLRPEDIVARLGGDEFAILADGMCDAADATAIAMRLHQTLDAPFSIKGGIVRMTASVGIALSGPQYGSADEMLRDADTAMYHAKAKGRGHSAMAAAEMHMGTRPDMVPDRTLRDAAADG